MEFIYKPEQAGRIHLVAEVDRLPGEVNREKNLAHGEITVLDDFLRLMFVEYEPTWEWRFIKEVFHRDRLVGMKGFRTFLYSSDPQVRQQNELFLPSMTPPREEFFENDLIFLGDMPSGPPTPALNDRFCKLVKEFVGDMGGGLVVLCGPRFGPQQLAKTPLADLLPVTVDPAARVRDQEPFALQLTAQAAEYPLHAIGRRLRRCRRCSRPGTTWGRCPGISRWKAFTAGHRAGRASHRHLRQRQEAAADRHPPVRPRRGRLPGLQRNVAIAAGPWRRTLPPVLERGHVAAGAEPCLGGEQAFRRPDRSTALPGRSDRDR